MTESFSHKGARSTALIATLSILVILESVALHFVLRGYSPLLAALLSIASLAAIGFIAADYIALGKARSSIAESELRLEVGKRISTSLPLKLIKSATAPTWKDLPDEPDRMYLNATKPAEPNVLLTLRAPVSLKILGTVPKKVTRLALYVDEPEKFRTIINSRLMQ